MPDEHDNLTSEEQEALESLAADIAGSLPAKVTTKAQGRLPYFRQAEIDRIREDDRPLSTIAEEHGVSTNTIRKIKKIGAYFNYEYQSREDAVTTKSQGDRTSASSRVTMHPKRGRPFTMNRGEVTAAEIQQIADDPRRSSDVARIHQLSRSYVVRIRADNHRTIPRPPYPISQRQYWSIRTSRRTDEEIMVEMLTVPIELIRAIRSGMFRDGA